jgi:hypothetical protein
MQFQLLSCDGRPDEQIRIIINDAIAPLTGIEGCEEDTYGLCPVPTFITAQKKVIEHTDWSYACDGEWDVPSGHDEWQTTTGDPPGASW